MAENIGSVEAKLEFNAEALIAAAKAITEAGKVMEDALGGVYDSAEKLWVE